MSTEKIILEEAGTPRGAEATDVYALVEEVRLLTDDLGERLARVEWPSSEEIDRLKAEVGSRLAEIDRRARESKSGLSAEEHKQCKELSLAMGSLSVMADLTDGARELAVIAGRDETSEKKS